MEDTFKAYGITKHIPGNINFNEIKNLVERNEISDVFKKIDLKFRDLDKRAVLIIGEPASGKTSIALSTGYKLWNAGFKKQVFYWNLNNNKGRKNIENSFSCLINDIKKTHHEIVLIIEDIHNNIDTFENLIIPLISSNENLVVILTSRNVGNFESTGESSEYTSFNQPKMKFRRREFANFGEDKIIEIKSDYKLANEILKISGLNTSDIDFNLARNKSGDNFNLVILDLLITITLEAKKRGMLAKDSKIKIAEIYQFIEDRIETIWRSLNNDICSKIDYLKIMFILSTFSKYEFPIESSYLKNYIKFGLSEFSILNKLVDQCELYQVKSQNNYGYILPHSKYAEIVNETLKKRFNLDLNGDDILFDYCESGDKIFILLNALMNDIRSYGGGYSSRHEMKNFSEFSFLVKKDPVKFQRVNLEKFKLNEINRFFKEIEFISPELTKNIIQNNLNNFKNLYLESYNLETINIFLGFLQHCSEEIKIIIFDHHKNYFLGDNFIDTISKNDAFTIGSFINVLAIHSEEISVSFIKKNMELLKSKCCSPNARELSQYLRIFLTRSEKINKIIIDKIFKEKIDEIFRSDMPKVLRFLDWDWWIPEGNVLIEIIEKYLKSENLRKIIIESNLNNIGCFFADLIFLKSSFDLITNVFILFKNEIIEKIIKSDPNKFNEFINLISGGNKDFALFIRNLLDDYPSVLKSC